MKGRERGLFAGAFLITLLVLGGITGATVLLTGGGASPAAPSSQAQYGVVEKESGYLPVAEEALTILFMGVGEEGSPPEDYLLLGFEPLTGRMPVLPLPQNLGVRFRGQEVTLAEAYEKGGAQGVKGAVEETLGIGVERYAILGRGEYMEAVGLIGRVEYELPYPVVLEQYGNRVVIDSGYQQLDGKRMADLTLYDGYPGGELGRLAVQGELTAAFINQNLGRVSSQWVEELFRQLVRFADTDVSFRDFENRIQAARFLAKLQVEPAVPIPVLGEEVEGEFLLDGSTRELVKKLFHQPF